MRARLLVGPIPAAIHGTHCFSPSSSAAAGADPLLPSPSLSWPHYRCSSRTRFPVVAVASAMNGEQDHYTVLGVPRNASSADIKRAYRLLARRYHPDVSKHSRAAEVFKSIRHAYEVLSDEMTRIQYDRVLRFQEGTARSSNAERQYYRPNYEDEVIVTWAEFRRRMNRERYWKQHVNYYKSSSHRDTEKEAEEGNPDQGRGPLIKVLTSAFISLFILRLFGSGASLAFSGMMALLDPHLDAGYKIGYLISWILGGSGGILLALVLHFASWFCGKTSSSVVVLVVIAMWVGSNIARIAPLPQGALLALLYMSIKLSR
ncbi:hypothetical protein Tsubulata_035374 [Turnera subulata]|uniref:J domain-containing protein n=1 Tax=Turnera subulata TaxID=218843 RepID=A0A9Q0G990_9ROSI|nr:hypothetical protein Tsubulata_035374 [Turnera subulata]